MILVDTSVLVDYLTGRSTLAVGQLDTLIERQSAFYLTPQVVQEVLQGARDAAQSLLHDDRDFDAIRRVRPLATLP